MGERFRLDENTDMAGTWKQASLRAGLGRLEQLLGPATKPPRFATNEHGNTVPTHNNITHRWRFAGSVELYLRQSGEGGYDWVAGLTRGAQLVDGALQVEIGR